MDRIESFNIYKNSLISFLETKNPNEEYCYYNRKTLLTVGELIDNIKEETDVGINFIKNCFILSADLFDRNKEKMKNFNRK